MLRYAVKRAVYPSHGGLRRIRFTENGRTFSALVPDQERFSQLREILLQRVYENVGVGGHTRGFGPGTTIVDAGANVGLFSLLASQHAKQVIALEPDPVNRRVLEVNLLTNDVDNVTVVPAALWTEDTQVPFALPAHELRRFAVSTGAHVAPDGASRQVEAISLDTLVRQYGTIDLLKLDIEGAEERILPATDSLGSVRQIVAELHLTEPGQERPMLQALQGAGFSTHLMTTASLYAAGQARHVLRNWRSVEGESLLKAGILAYLLAPLEPLRPGRDMPLLFAERSASVPAARRDPVPAGPA